MLLETVYSTRAEGSAFLSTWFEVASSFGSLHVEELCHVEHEGVADLVVNLDAGIALLQCRGQQNRGERQ